MISLPFGSSSQRKRKKKVQWASAGRRWTLLLELQKIIKNTRTAEAAAANKATPRGGKWAKFGGVINGFSLLEQDYSYNLKTRYEKKKKKKKLGWAQKI